MPANIFVFSNDTVYVDRSSKGFIYVLDRENVTRLSASGSFTYSMPCAPISLQVGRESNSMAVSFANASVALYLSEEEYPLWIRRVNGTPLVIAISEKGTQFGYTPDVVYVITSYDSVKALVGLSALKHGEEVLYYEFQGVLNHVSYPDNTHYLALTVNNSHVVIFNKGATSPLGWISVSGQVLETNLGAAGRHLAILYLQNGDHKVSVFSLPSLIHKQTVSVEGKNVKNLLLHGDSGIIYIKSDNKIMRCDVEKENCFKAIREIPELDNFVIPSVTDENFVSSPGKIQTFVPGMVVAKWSCLIGGEPVLLITDAGGWQVIGYDSNRLVIIDNTRNYSGSGTFWMALGVLVIFQISTVLLTHYWNRLKSLDAKRVIVLFCGAIAGVAVGSLFVDLRFVEWFSNELIYLIICGSVAALTCLLSWESQAGLAGMVFSTVFGLPLSVLFSWLAAFFIWTQGYEFPGSDEAFTTAALSLMTGLRMGFTGGIIGWILFRLVK
ncbi:MAG: hypothetical protein QW520_06590 [Methanomassiliicoccales archaeon]